jgi:hypothetical protein
LRYSSCFLVAAGVMVDKRDRKALVISLIGTLIFIGLAVSEGFEAFLLWLVAMSVYWGYRFVKDDISFIKIDGKD